MSIFMYSHGGSGNHGCEAIVRGTASLLNFEKMTLYSNNVDQDYQCGLGDITELCESRNRIKRFNIKRIIASALVRIVHKENYATRISIEHILKRYGENDIGLSIGGDNYCYPGFEEFGIINEMLRKKKITTVLWGCSIEPEMIDETMKQDLMGYKLIVARESITYSALKNIGANVVCYPDPAFQLQPIKCKLPDELEKRKFIGINLSPHIMRCEVNEGIALENYQELINYILSETEYDVALIPHVVWEGNDDRSANMQIKDAYKNESRVVVIGDNDCRKLKYIISQCELFVGARTHATIAAYSSCVPTLVVGYSVKAKGIAKDLFGTEENYVLPVQGLDDPFQLVESFKWLYSNRIQIRHQLEDNMPDYIAGGKMAKEEIRALMQK